MGMIVQHNMNALNAYNRLNANVAGMKKASEKLSSGYRINRAGDDAAGLAISEKMRSQIKGLNQAIRNSQDGINMIQTFEGAAQETHSILQRMKELATESANGTYDNATDRAAIQLEFEQLNDELNQIADTDFNGTIVLNGGEMADGLKADGGEFNYKKAYDAAEAAPEATDVTKYVKDKFGVDEAAGEILDNSDYDADAANALWDKLGLDVKDTQEINIAFKKNGDKWEAVAITSGTAAQHTPGTPAKPASAEASDAGVTVTIADAAKITEDVTLTWHAATGVAAGYWEDGNGDTYSDSAQLNTKYGVTYTGAEAGTITLKKAVDATADQTVEGSEKDITKDVDLSKLTVTAVTDADATGNGGFKVSWGAYDVNAVFGAYQSNDGDYITLKFTNTAETTYAPNNIGVAEDSLTVKANGTTDEKPVVPEGAIKIELDKTKLNDAMMNEDVKAALDKLADLEVEYTKAAFKKSGTTNGPTATGDVTVDTNGKISIWDGSAAIEIGTITVDTNKIDGWDTTNGTMKFKLNVDQYNVANLDDIKANSIETSDVIKKAMEPAKSVTNANAFKNSTAIMTYTEDITLQTGSRTKDAVNFSFSYNRDGTADMGDLKANLNLSARADGLNTENLSLANQDDANYAIDQIDKAINKTSMVRATFGAIQNRLEHKITNLTTTSENLQEAESSIRDTDMASEMMNYTKYNILQQAAQSMLAQANQQPQSILQLLG